MNMHADFLGPYNANVVVNAFNGITAEGLSPAEAKEQFPGTSPLEAYVLGENARIVACLASALEQLGCLGREVADAKRRLASLGVDFGTPGD